MQQAATVYLPISNPNTIHKQNLIQNPNGPFNVHLRRLSNDALVHGIRQLVASERKITREILEYINEIERRRLCVELGFASSYEWLTKSLGYSASAAHRRIQAARLLWSLEAGIGGPCDVAKKIETGTVNLTTLAQVQTTIRSEEKRSGINMTAQRKNEIISKIETKSSRETEIVLAEMFPQTAARKESVTVVDGNHVRVHVTLTQSQMQKLERIGELLSHRLTKGGVKASLGEVIEAAADELLKRKDPFLRKEKEVTKIIDKKPTHMTATNGAKSLASMPQSKTGSGVSVQPKSKPVGVSLKKQITVRDQGKCQYLDPRTGQRCESRFQLQIDHKYPRALGGGNEPSNLRVMCRTHNLLMAERWFGEKKMSQYSRHIRLENPLLLE